MPLEDIIALCIGVPCLISLIVLLYIICIKSANTDREYKKVKIDFYKKRIEEIDNFIGYAKGDNKE